jgi:ubiquitin-conjugating enzyme E2 variant
VTARRLYPLAIVAAAAGGLLHLVLLLTRLPVQLGAGSWLPVLAGAALGALAADLVSGLVHWACDTWGDERTPLLGGLIGAFREHHRDPRAMLAHGWMGSTGETAVPSALCLLAMTLPASRAFLAGHLGLYAFLWSLCVFGGWANLIHRWAHAPSPPRPARWLQRCRVILSPERHARHHAGRHTRGYCISTGWANPVLDAVGFWRGLERAASALTGARPRGRYRVDGHQSEEPSRA